MSVWIPLDETLAASGRPLLLVDRDGVVIEDRDYLGDPSGVVLLPGAADALALARARGWLAVGVSNQSGIGRGRFGEADFAAVMRRLDALLARAGAGFDGFYYCPHAPADRCACRKPLTGLIDQAGLSGRLVGRKVWMVGDKADDVALGHSLGARSVLVRTGHGAREEASVRERWAGDPDVFIRDDLAAAVALALAGPPEGGGP
ncbi:MAG: D-glycero-alpha-D-manno-heptose-1,7-bisphosphate 7-phosphatase [Candidatus Krumholzibacteriia bacterium]